MVLCPRSLQIGCTSGFLILSVALLIVGILLPSKIVEPLIRNGVKNRLPILPENYDGGIEGQKFKDYLNKSVDVNYYIFNLTNLYDVLTKGDKPNYQELVINFKRWETKHNPTWNEDSTLFSYTKISSYQVANQRSQDILNSEIVSFNPLYLGGSAQAARQLAVDNGTSVAFLNGVNAPPVSDRYINNVIINRLLLTVNNTYDNYVSSSLYSAFKVLSIPAYLRVSGGLLQQNGLISGAAELPFAWCGLNKIGDGPKGFLYSQNATLAVLTGFELYSNPNVMAIDAPTCIKIFQSFTTDIRTWLGVSQQFNLADTTQLAQATGFMQQKLNVTAPQFTSMTLLNAFGWIRTSTQVGNVPFERLVLTGVKSAIITGTRYFPFANMTATPPTPFPEFDAQLSNFQDLAYLQLGTGAITSALIAAAQGSPLAAPTSTTNLLGNSAGLGQNIVNGKLIFDENLPIEFSPACLQTNSTYYATNGIAAFPINHAKLLLKVSVTTTFMAGFLCAKIGPLAAYSAALQNPQTASLTWTQFVPIFIARAQASNMSASEFTILQQHQPILLQLAPILDVPGSNRQCVIDYFTKYLNTYLTGSTAKLRADGTTSNNAGLFIRRTPMDLLFTQPTPTLRLYPSPIPGAADDYFTVVPFGEVVFDPVKYQARLNAHLVRDVDRPSIYYSGKRDYREASSLYSYYGTRNFSTWCEIDDPAGTGNCRPATKKYNDWQLWQERTYFDHLSDGLIFEGLQDDIRPELELFIQNFRRKVLVKYAGEVEVKKITLRRYEVHPAMIITSDTSAGTPNPWKSQTFYTEKAPDGTIDVTAWRGGLPTIVSFPHFYLADSRFLNTMTGMNPNEAVHKSEIDVDPLTGYSMRVNKRLQAAFRLTPNHLEWGTLYDKLFSPANGFAVENYPSSVYIPYYWGEEVGEITDEDASSYDSKILKSRKIAKIISIVMIVVGAVGIALFGFLLVRTYRLPDDTINNKDNNTSFNKNQFETAAISSGDGPSSAAASPREATVNSLPAVQLIDIPTNTDDNTTQEGKPNSPSHKHKITPSPIVTFHTDNSPSQRAQTPVKIKVNARSDSSQQ